MPLFNLQTSFKFQEFPNSVFYSKKKKKSIFFFPFFQDPIQENTLSFVVNEPLVSLIWNISSFFFVFQDLKVFLEIVPQFGFAWPQDKMQGIHFWQTTTGVMIYP